MTALQVELCPSTKDRLKSSPLAFFGKRLLTDVNQIKMRTGLGSNLIWLVSLKTGKFGHRKKEKQTQMEEGDVKTRRENVTWIWRQRLEWCTSKQNTTNDSQQTPRTWERGMELVPHSPWKEPTLLTSSVLTKFPELRDNTLLLFQIPSLGHSVTEALRN